MFKMNINQFMKRKLIGSIAIATMAVSFLLSNPATASADHIGYIYRTKCSTNHKGGHSLYSILYITTDIKFVIKDTVLQPNSYNMKERNVL